MIGLDTNVLVRYIMQDDPLQSPSATRLMGSLTVAAPGLVSLVSVVELAWVLSRSYSLTREQVAAALGALLQSRELVVERADQVAQALRSYRTQNVDLADGLIARAAMAAGCDRIMTFDAQAAKAAGMTLID